MATKRVIAITGVSGFWGNQLAKRLVLDEALHIIGIDREKPEVEIDGLDFIQADIRNPLLPELLEDEAVDTVCHMAFNQSDLPNEAAFDMNVIGTVNVFGASVAANVRKIVLKSSTGIYGAFPNNPGFIHEEHDLRGSRRYGYLRDLTEIESFCNGFRQQHPEVQLTILRYANIVGPDVSTPMTRFLSDRYAPILLGFDPMMQFVHQADVINSLLHAIREDHPGTYNIAAEGLMPLTKAMAIVGKLPLPVVHVFAYWGLSAFGPTAQKHMPIEPDYLRYRWVADTARMSTDFGFIPMYTAKETLREFAGELRTQKFAPEATDLSYDEERLRDTLERRRRMRASQAPATKSEKSNRRKSA
ncbi:MAG: NAD-dependent epimerase/dehydratase family protein [Anaerolineales bacterium]